MARNNTQVELNNGRCSEMIRPVMSVFAFLLLVCSYLSALNVCLSLCLVLYKIRSLQHENSMVVCGP
jgi:hypothetical protein